MKLSKEMKDIIIESLNLDKTKDLKCIGVRKFGPKMFFILLKNGKQYVACIPLKSNQIRFYTLNRFEEIADDFCTGYLASDPIILEYGPNEDRTKITIKFSSEKFVDGKSFDIDSELVVMKIQGFNFNWYCNELNKWKGWDDWIFYI